MAREQLGKYIPRLRERDGDDCQLCLDRIDFTLQFPDPMSRSVDHKRPRAHGGRTEMRNLRLAHVICNTARGSEWQAPPPMRVASGRAPRRRASAAEDRMSSWRSPGGRVLPGGDPVVLSIGEEPVLPCS